MYSYIYITISLSLYIHMYVYMYISKHPNPDTNLTKRQPQGPSQPRGPWWICLGSDIASASLQEKHGDGI